MRRLRGFLAVVFVFGLLLDRSFSVLAEEMDAKTDPGVGMPGEEESGEPPLPVAETDEVTILTEAAAALDATHPELAAKLRALAVNEPTEKGEANEQAEQ